MKNQFTFPLRKLFGALLSLVAIVTLLSLFFSVVNFGVRISSLSVEMKDVLIRIFVIFYLGSEVNLPTWYASLTLFFSAVLLGLIATVEGDSRGYQSHWRILGIIFVLMSVDEVAMLHEKTELLLEVALSSPVSFNYIGPILLTILFFGVGIIFWTFAQALPPFIRNLLFLSAILYVGGAVGVDVIERLNSHWVGDTTWTNEALSYMEEFLEMMGIALFNFSLLSYLKQILVNQPLIIRFE